MIKRLQELAAIVRIPGLIVVCIWFGLFLAQMTISEGHLDPAGVSECLRNMECLSKALQRYHSDHRKWPDSLADLVPDYVDDTSAFYCPHPSPAAPEHGYEFGDRTSRAVVRCRAHLECRYRILPAFLRRVYRYYRFGPAVMVNEIPTYGNVTVKWDSVPSAVIGRWMWDTRIPKSEDVREAVDAGATSPANHLQGYRPPGKALKR